ncbi:uncharacterized protein N7473_010765 [Penicillium subrubescens]|uniref:Rho-GAP domain-containing protein n=1 Tax=Penicillium subrubescens TaxID=1316194 RepID=A0A1Q5T2N6_9EURO|nr:uncharacterized protein N7473_010765 [Penicillium subrubescens]KAJ5883879.1 hypothetical protein N7473_010765 [Penicillium subrubescens]OKO94510.1 hypothetical protein PENSUB_11777 [Penicillium subrubescens]
MPSRNSTIPNLDLKSLKVDFSSGKLTSPLSPGAQSSDGLSPLTPRSPKSSSSSPFLKGATIRPVTQDSSSKGNSPVIAPKSPGLSATELGPEPSTPGLTAIPQYFPSSKESGKGSHTRDASKSFFGNLKAPKPSHRAQRSDSSENSTEPPKSRGSSRDRKTAPKFYESTPDLPGTLAKAGESEKNGNGNSDKTAQPAGPKKTNTEMDPAPFKKSKPRFANLLTRSRSIRVDESSGNRAAGRRPSTGLAKLEEFKSTESSNAPSASSAPRAATARPERPVEGGLYPPPRHADAASLRKEKSHGGSMVNSGSLSQVSGASAAIFNNLKQSSSGAADRIGKAGKGFFGKITRSGSTNERELINDDNYVCSVINLPLIEQARKTRIAKKLDGCRDKTEFWMPALPYRCIDYLNYKGCEEEGLYRVPGSGREVKHWQRRFDSQLDVSLFDVPDLYDINTVGSLFKAWLRELPDELFPKATQDMIAEKCEGATTAPQLLKDELSKLPPYNYYLLFAITCHLNLLHSYVDQNKMDYRNLCICFQPCMKIDAFCFQFLVCDWKNCWQGCWTEKEYIQKEKEMDEMERKAVEEKEAKVQAEATQSSSRHERAVSSGSSSRSEEEKPRPETSRGRKAKPKNIETAHTRSISQLPELGPPLSPIKI